MEALGQTSHITSFRDRRHAGRLLAVRLRSMACRDEAVLLALPRGGIPVAHAISVELEMPLDIIVVRKLGVPGHEEYAMGAVAGDAITVLREDVLYKAAIPQSAVNAAIARERGEIARREALYRNGRPPLPLEGRTVVLVDDGLATGSSMQAAVKAVAVKKPARIVVAVPVGASDSCANLRMLADEVVCLLTPKPFYAVSLWYEDFPQVSDAEARALIDEATQAHRRHR